MTVVEVAHTSDVGAARRTAKGMAAEMGFDATASEEIALAVSELASNLVKHANGGDLVLTPLPEGERVGIQVEAVDKGPGIPDVERVIADGFSTAGSLGYGLGSVNRLMDEFDIRSQRGPGGGTTVVCKRWIRPESHGATLCPLEFGVATRRHPSTEVNGDAFIIKRWDGAALAGVIDGLGHGQFAHRAAETARQYIETHYDQTMESLFRGVGRACRATRGAVMALARFDFGMQISDCGLEKLPVEVSGVRLTFASVGNIEARVLVSPQSEVPNPKSEMNFIVRRGIVGVNAPNPVITHHGWDPDNLLILHSDGVRTHWKWEEFPEVATESATALAQRMLRQLAKEEDDATVVVIKNTEPRP
ncbi:MAG: ATP-binding protein [Armatimonadetes bacterium]|nr:ATP-binding protein [Armatimonadota bacterium]